MSNRRRWSLARAAASWSLCAGAAVAGDPAAYPQPALPIDGYLTVVDVMDANGDGLLDLLAGHVQAPPMLALAQGPLQCSGFARMHPEVVKSACFAEGDFDGDGHSDVAVGAPEIVILLLGAGDGSFPIARSSDVDASSIRSIKVLDADADGDLDLLAALDEPDGVQPLLGDGDGLLAPLALIPTAAAPGGLAVGDVDLDGFPDFARSVVTPTSGTIQLALGVGDGSFAAATDYDAPAAGQLELVPLDADGWLDLAWSGGPTGVRLSVGGALGPAQPIAGMSGGSSVPIEAVDVDEDADLDLVVPTSQFVFVAINDAGTLTLDPAAGCEAEGTVLARDLDGDGAPDLAGLTHDDGYYYGYATTTTVSMTRGRHGQGFVVPLFSDVGVGYFDAMLAADLDGDGVDDLVLAELQTTRVCGGLGDGRFGTPVVSITHEGYGTCTAKGAGDFDGDGGLDVLGRYETESIVSPVGVRLLLGQGDLTLTIGAKTPLSKQLGNLETCDFDLDGDLDTLSAKNGAGGLALLLNDGTGKFVVSGAPLAGVASDVATGDLNADGLPDVAATLQGGLSVAVLLGDGSGALGDPTPVWMSGARNVAIGDVDDDGLGDLAVGGYDEAPYAHELTVLRSLPTGDFALMGVADPFLSSFTAVVLTVSDVTGDGAADVLLSGTTGIAVIRSDGFTGLAPAEPFLSSFAALSPAVSAATARAIGRLDGDALPDVVSVLFKDFVYEDNGGARTSLAQPAASWLGLGHVLPGVAGAPLLSGVGSLQPHSDLMLTVTHAAPAAPAWLIAGASAIELPFKGGTLVPAPDMILGGLATDAHGDLELIGSWPDGVPAGASLVLQAWIADAIGPAGFSATNGLLLSPH